ATRANARNASDQRTGRGNFLPGKSAGDATLASEVAESERRWNARSRADWKRSSGFFSRQWSTIRLSAGVILGLEASKSAGSSLRMALAVSAGVGPSKARRPENIS